MTKFCLSSAAMVILLTASAAQSQTVSANKKHAHQEPAAAQTSSVPPDPAVMQKWFSGAVDDILTSTDKALNGVQGTER